MGAISLVVVSFLIFLATNALPGNVAEMVLGKNASPESIAQLTSRLGLDHGLMERYASWLSGVVTRFDLGNSAVAVSLSSPDPSILSAISEPLKNSLVLASATLVLLVPVSLFLGTLAAIRAGRPADYAISYTSLVIGAMPEFVLGTFLIFVMFTVLGLLPPVSLVSPGMSPLETPKVLVLPVLTLLGVSMAFCARQVRAGVVRTLNAEYVMMARLSGIKEARVIWKYALRNALATSVQTFGQTTQYLLGGIIVVETLFGYPGIGRVLVTSVQQRDVTEVQGITLLLAAVYIVIQIVSDVMVLVLVPKLRTGSR